MRAKAVSAGAVVAVLLSSFYFAPAAVAQVKSGHGIGGFWASSRGATPPVREATKVEAELMSLLPKNTKLLGDSGVVEFSPGEYSGLDILPDLIEAAKSFDPDAQRNVSTTCRAPGLIYSMQGPFPIEIFEGRDLIVIKLEYYDLVRTIFMNETEHPDDLPHTMTGHSIGHWEGDTLIVDTASLAVGTLFNNGVNHTQNVHLLERFRLDGNDKLVITQQFEDPGSFNGVAARVTVFNRGHDHVYPYDCDPAYGLSIDSRVAPKD